MSETGHAYDDFSIPFTRGEELELSLTATKTQSGTTSALNVSSGVLWLIGKRNRGDADAAALLRLNNDDLGGIVLLAGGTGGLATATIPGARTAGLPARETTLYVKVFWVDADGETHVLQTGKLIARE